MFVERCDHNRFSRQLTERVAAPVGAMVPTATGPVATTHNNPPDVIRTEPAEHVSISQAKEAFTELSAFLQDNPVIQTREQAQQGSAYLERTRLSLNEAREALSEQTRPFLDRLAKIRAAFDLVREKTKTNAGGPLEAAYNTLRKRMTDYANAVEAARAAEAERLRLEAEEHERIAREAERAEQDAIAGADVGECTDVGTAIEQADQAFADYRRADKTAAIAERNVPARFASALGGRAQSMRTIEVLAVENLDMAIKVLGLTDKIKEAVLSSARDYRKAFDELPAGITATFERSM